jgi:hypothetical protein
VGSNGVAIITAIINTLANYSYLSCSLLSQVNLVKFLPSSIIAIIAITINATVVDLDTNLRVLINLVATFRQHIITIDHVVELILKELLLGFSLLSFF